MTHKRCKIISNQEISKGVFEMVVDTRDFPKSIPGQFVMVHLDKGELLLPRPISICRQEKNLMLLVYKVFGKGTDYLSKLKQNDEVRLMGPLGNGFTIKDGLKKIALIGGGIGIPPMVSIFDAIKDKNIEIHVYLGFKEGHYLTTLFPDANLHVITEDLSAFKDPPYPIGEVFPVEGNTITLLDNKSGGKTESFDEMFACGPKPMLAALAKYADEKGVPLQVSLEERMACGIGVCMGCVTAMKANKSSSTANKSSSQQSGAPNYMKICCVGPVFYSDKVVLDG